MSTLKELFLKQVLPRMALQAGDRILDVGCGDGWACRAVAALAAEGMVVGIDADGEAIRTARRESAEFDNILYIAAEAEENPWQDNFFSHVVLIDTLDVLRDPAAALRHLHRVLSPGGWLWILSPPLAASEPAALDILIQTQVALLEAGGFASARAQSAAGVEDRAPGGLLVSAQKPPQG